MGRSRAADPQGRSAQPECRSRTALLQSPAGRLRTGRAGARQWQRPTRSQTKKEPGEKAACGPRLCVDVLRIVGLEAILADRRAGQQLKSAGASERDGSA